MASERVTTARVRELMRDAYPKGEMLRICDDLLDARESVATLTRERDEAIESRNLLAWIGSENRAQVERMTPAQIEYAQIHARQHLRERKEKADARKAEVDGLRGENARLRDEQRLDLADVDRFRGMARTYMDERDALRTALTWALGEGEDPGAWPDGAPLPPLFGGLPGVLTAPTDAEAGATLVAFLGLRSRAGIDLTLRSAASDRRICAARRVLAEVTRG